MHEKEIVSSALLYRDQTDLKNFLKEQLRTAPPDCSWLVLIHTCCHSPASAVAIAQHVKEVLPDAAVLGTSAAAVIHHGSIYTDQCLLHITRFRRTRPEIFRLSLDGKTPEELAEEAAENFPADSVPCLHFSQISTCTCSRSCNIWNSCGSTFPLPAA